MAGILILGIDPGPQESAYFVLEDGKITPSRAYFANDQLLGLLGSAKASGICRIAIETLQNYNAPMSGDTINTVKWVGRFIQQALCSGFEEEVDVREYVRPSIKAFLVGTASCNDVAVKRALECRYGYARKGQPLEGLKGAKDHQWAALAVATFCWDGLLLGNKW